MVFQCTSIWRDLFFSCFMDWWWLTQFSLNRSFLQVFDLSSPINTGTEVVSWQIWFPGLSLCCHDRLCFRCINNWVLCCFLFSLKLAYIDIKCGCSLLYRGKGRMWCARSLLFCYFSFLISPTIVDSNSEKNYRRNELWRLEKNRK